MYQDAEMLDFLTKRKDKYKEFYDDDFKLDDNAPIENPMTEDEIRQMNHESNVFMKKLYVLMRKDKGRHISINYPGGPLQFEKDIKNGVYDD